MAARIPVPPAAPLATTLAVGAASRAMDMIQAKDSGLPRQRNALGSAR
jgi:hypothetical protein